MQPQGRLTPSGGDQSGGYPEILPVDAAATKPLEELRREKRQKTNGESLPREKQTDDRSPGIGYLEFLKNCSLCKKMLQYNDPVYIYGYLGAYCSPECRQLQMDLDKFDLSISSDEIASFPLQTLKP